MPELDSASWTIFRSVSANPSKSSVASGFANRIQKLMDRLAHFAPHFVVNLIGQAFGSNFLPAQLLLRLCCSE